MKATVLVIAHNEESGIGACIESLLAQTTPAEEIVVISHNSTDHTAEIAEKYPVRVIRYEGPKGSAYARLRGLEEVRGDAVFCIDGDACAASNWLATLINTLSTPDTVLVGSWIRMRGTLWARIAPLRWYFTCAQRGFGATDWLWGASYGFWTADTERVRTALHEGLRLSKELDLPTNPDDYWIALFMSKHGAVEVTNKTWVMAHAKEKTSFGGVWRGIVSWFSIRKKILSFLKQGGVPGIIVS